MKIKWVGHACFLIEGKEGRVMTDPYGESIPYRPPDYTADVITVSHDHFDHNAVERVKGSPTVIRGEGTHSASGIHFQGIASFHDESGGAKRGTNTIFAFEMEGLKMAHLGDLGEALSDEQMAALAEVEVLFVPVGGHFTIGPDEAAALVKRLPNLKVVIPMHFKTDSVDFPIEPVDRFLEEMGSYERPETSQVEITPESLREGKRVIVLEHAL